MGKLSISVATWDYDRVRAIIDGRVPIEGCDVNHLATAPEETFFRALAAREFDITELSLSSYMIALSRGGCGYRAIPVFPSRAFRHSAIYVRADRGITRPQDLRGKVVGVPEYQLTANLWVRGILEDEYGVRPNEISWRRGGMEEPGRREKIVVTPPGVEIETISDEDTLSQMLADGRIDALIAPRAPSCFVRREPHVSRMFPDFRNEERAYFLKTRIFPIMHVLAIREELLDTHHWLATSVFKAFVQAKRLCMQELHEVTALKITLPWVVAEAESTRDTMGEDFWPYGLQENRITLGAAVRYAWEQGLTARPLSIEELFVPSTLETSKI
jgi:4,5-dihydroxyphthalate decarboxylase